MIIIKSNINNVIHSITYWVCDSSHSPDTNRAFLLLNSINVNKNKINPQKISTYAGLIHLGRLIHLGISSSSISTIFLNLLLNLSRLDLILSKSTLLLVLCAYSDVLSWSCLKWTFDWVETFPFWVLDNSGSSSPNSSFVKGNARRKNKKFQIAAWA